MERNENEIDDLVIKNNKIRLTVRGVIKKELAYRLQNKRILFPMRNKSSIEHVKNYFTSLGGFERKRNEPSIREYSILKHAKLMHKMEIARIKKAFRTIDSNVELEIINKKDVDIGRIKHFIYLVWLSDEFFISKEVIRKYIYAFSVFYPQCKPISKVKKSN